MTKVCLSDFWPSSIFSIFLNENCMNEGLERKGKVWVGIHSECFIFQWCFNGYDNNALFLNGILKNSY